MNKELDYPSLVNATKVFQQSYKGAVNNDNNMSALNINSIDKELPFLLVMIKNGDFSDAGILQESYNKWLKIKNHPVSAKEKKYIELKETVEKTTRLLSERHKNDIRLVDPVYFKNAADLWKSYLDEFVEVTLHKNHKKLGELLAHENPGNEIIAQMDKILKNQPACIQTIECFFEVMEYMNKLRPLLEDLQQIFSK